MPAETALPEQATLQAPPPPKKAAGIAAHLLVLIFTITGAVIQLFVPHFTTPLQELAEQPLPIYTSALLRFQHVTLMLSCLFPVAVLFLAWQSRFKTPLSRLIVTVIICATLLEGATAFALLVPMRGVIDAVESIKPVGEAPGVPK